jgi:List-Bact-rpt repeat protein
MFDGRALRYERFAPLLVLALLNAGCGNGTVESPAASAVDPTSVAAPSSRPRFDLTVAIVGSGTVGSNPVGIDCGSDCTETYFKNTTVTLTATPAAGYSFVGWSGTGISCAGVGDCTFTIAAAQSVTATFSPNNATVYTLQVSRSGDGAVASSPAGIDCGSDCSESYVSGTSVVLAATPGAGSFFSGWNGGGCSGTGTCTVTMTSALTTTATFTPITFPLNVSVSGSGTVTSAPAGIDCGASCTANYNTGTSVTLTATPTAGFSFSGWSGNCTGTGTCTVAMTAARTVTATFVPITFALTVSVSGSGTVTSSPAGIDCGVSCSASYNSGTSVTLTAAAASGFTFSGWSGACTGTGTCALTMSVARTVTATFTPSTFTLNVTVSGAGSVSSSPAGISCGSDCSEAYANGTSVSLTASPASGSIFSGWGGACAGTGACTVTMTTARNVTATFAANSSSQSYQLTWNAVTDPRVTGYKLYFSTAPLGGGVAPTIVDVGNNTTYTFDPTAAGILSGATVYFGVTAIGGGLESPLSNVVNVLIQ